MPKRLLDAALLTAGRAVNRDAVNLGPGYIRVSAAGPDEAEVFVYGDIGGWLDGVNADDFVREIAGIKADTISVRINSPGGVVFDGVAIYNALAQHAAKVVATVEGIAASIASVILMAADEIRIVEGAHIMVHRPWSFAIGDAEAMRKEADVLDSLEAGIIDIYEARTGAGRADLEAWVAGETWFDAKGAVANGFADTIIGAKGREKKLAHARSALLPLFNRAPLGLIAEPDEIPGIRKFERFLRDEEQLSHAQAKRIAAMARKHSPSYLPDPWSGGQGPRDEAAIIGALDGLAAHIKTISKNGGRQ